MAAVTGTIPPAVRSTALFPIATGPDVPAALPLERVRGDGVAALLLPGPSGALVEVRSLAGDRLESELERLRALLRERGKTRAAWFVPVGAEPADAARRLRRLGLEPYEEPPFEPRFASMVRVQPTEAAPPGVVARFPETFEEYLAGVHVGEEAFAVPEEDRRAWHEHERTIWELQASGRSPSRLLVALVDGEVVGNASALLCDHAVNLLGGSVRPDMRGRGVYRALVRARWEVAAARGTPALTVQAGAMSRPVLERLGFETVGWTDCLLDELGAA